MLPRTHPRERGGVTSSSAKEMPMHHNRDWGGSLNPRRAGCDVICVDDGPYRILSQHTPDMGYLEEMIARWALLPIVMESKLGTRGLGTRRHVDFNLVIAAGGGSWWYGTRSRDLETD